VPASAVRLFYKVLKESIFSKTQTSSLFLEKRATHPTLLLTMHTQRKGCSSA